MKIKKVVIPAAGLGTRLLPVTKEIPKEMLPIAIRKGKEILMKPLLQATFEQFYSIGVRDFCIITGRGKREIEDHFTVDWHFLDMLKPSVWRTDMESFYKQLESTRIYFVNQGKKRGFGDAVLYSEEFVGADPFMVHAGDDWVQSRGRSHLSAAADLLYKENAEAVVLLEDVEDPRGYGVVLGDALSPGVIRITRIEEKPKNPISHLAVIAVYAFKPIIFNAIRSSRSDKRGEIQLTSGIQSLINDGKKVLGLRLAKGDRRVDIGSAEGYIRSLSRAILD